MNGFMLLGMAFCSVTLLAGCWLGWQLLRQNGRILLRLDELEQRFDELEFGETDEMERGSPEAQHVESAAANGQTADQTNARPHPGPLPQGEGEADERASRFGNRSLARSRIKRDGLKAGTAAPSFRLPRLDGGQLSLEELRGKRVLLVFSDPHCGPCEALAPELEKFHRATREAGRVTPCAPQDDEFSQNGAHGVARPTIVMISRGDPKENRAKVKEHGLTFPIVLQQRWEISRRYAIFATPVAYLIDEAGIIAHDVAVGVEPILELISRTANPVGEPEMAVDSPEAVKSATP